MSAKKNQRAQAGRGSCRSTANRTPPAARKTNNSTQSRIRPKLPTVSLGSGPKIVTATDLLNDTTIRPPDELIPGLAHLKTKIMLAAQSKAGKTSMSIDLAVGIVTGTFFMQWSCCCGKVLYVNYELDAAFFRERVRVVIASRGATDMGSLHIMNLRGSRAGFDDVKREIIEISQREKYALVIIDPIYKATESKSDGGSHAVAKICGALDDIVKATGAAVMFTHHFNKGNSARVASIDRMAGSGTWARDLDTIITVTEYRGMPEHYIVETTLRNFPAFPPFVVRRNGLVTEVREDIQIPAAATQEETDDRGLLAMLGTEPVTTVEWRTLAAQQGVPPSTFYRILESLRHRGIVIRDNLTRRWSRPTPPVVSNPNPPAIRSDNPEQRVLSDLDDIGSAPSAPTAELDGGLGAGEKSENSGNNGNPELTPEPRASGTQ